MSAQSTVRVTMANMLLKLAASFGCIALVAAGGTSLTSVGNLHGGSYTYGVDHDSYGAWYGTAHPLLSIGHHGLDEGHHGNLYGHAHAVPHGDYGYATYGSGYGHGAYATSYQNLKVKFGGEKVLHAGHAVHHGLGATSYSKIVQKFGHGLYDGHDIGHDTYAGGYGHAISSQNFNLKSYVHPPVHVEHITHAPIHETISYAPHHETHTPHLENHAPLHETYAPHHETISYIPAHSYAHAPEDFTATYPPLDHGHQTFGDFYGLGDYSHLLSYGHGHETPRTYYAYDTPHGFESHANYAPYGFEHGLSYYHP